jgi:NADH-quinone oxidoreductase subunit E
MSVRRLAEVQPDSFAFSKANAVAAKNWIGKYPKGRQQSAVIPLLMIAQEQEGWVTRPAIEEVSKMLDMPLIRVLEVATFYTQFQLKPVGTRAHVQVCGTTPCMLRGAGALMDVCREKIHPEQFHTNADGTLSWEEVECAGACVNAPMIMIFKDTYEDLTPERLAEIIDAFEAGKGASVKTGTQLADRYTSEPEGERTTLLDEAALTKLSGGTAKPRAAKSSVAKSSVAKDGKAKKTGPAAKVPPAPEKPTLDSPDRPVSLKKPAKPDDLKLISGVGPKFEAILNGLGIYTFEQVASWQKRQRDWVDGYLNFKGRIERDDWIRQAKALAKGGRAEYIRVFGKKPL